MKTSWFEVPDCMVKSWKKVKILLYLVVLVVIFSGSPDNTEKWRRLASEVPDFMTKSWKKRVQILLYWVVIVVIFSCSPEIAKITVKWRHLGSEVPDVMTKSRTNESTLVVIFSGYCCYI